MRRLALTLALLSGLALAHGCSDECGDDEELVCDQDGERCYCSVVCSVDSDCDPGLSCHDNAKVCVYLASKDNPGWCGTQGQMCCPVTGIPHGLCEWGMSCVNNLCLDEDVGGTGPGLP